MRSSTLVPLRGIIWLSLLAAGLAGTAFGQLLYTPNVNSNTISEFTTNSGPLAGLSCLAYDSASPTNSVATTGTLNPRGLALTPNGSFLYAANSGASGGISAYSVGSSPGYVGKLTPLANGTGCPAANGETCPNYSLTGVPWGAIVDPSGKYLYVSLNGTLQIAAYSINSSTGALTFISTVATASSPTALVVASIGSNEYLYAGLHGGQIAMYPIDGSGGPGSATTYNINGGSGAPTGLAIYGGTLYAVDHNSSGPAGPDSMPSRSRAEAHLALQLRLLRARTRSASPWIPTGPMSMWQTRATAPSILFWPATWRHLRPA